MLPSTQWVWGTKQKCVGAGVRPPVLLEAWSLARASIHSDSRQDLPPTKHFTWTELLGTKQLTFDSCNNCAVSVVTAPTLCPESSAI